MLDIENPKESMKNCWLILDKLRSLVQIGHEGELDIDIVLAIQFLDELESMGIKREIGEDVIDTEYKILREIWDQFQ